MHSTRSEILFDILLILLSLIGWFHLIHSLGVGTPREPRMPGWFMVYWSAMALPLICAVLGRKEFASVWKALCVIGLIVLVVVNYELFAIVGQNVGELSSAAYIILLSFNMATVLMVYRAYLGGWVRRVRSV